MPTDPPTNVCLQCSFRKMVSIHPRSTPVLSLVELKNKVETMLDLSQVDCVSAKGTRNACELGHACLVKFETRNLIADSSFTACKD